jgi:lipopolysaccharide transport system permease protein
MKIIVDADKPSFGLGLKELKDYRDLFSVLAYRDLRVRYAQTFLGLFWALLQPLATLAIFIIVFGKVVNVDTGGVPYPLFAIAGMSAWTYFGFVLNQSGQSIINSQEMIKKIYFPRLVIPLSKAMVGFVDFAIALLILIVLMIVYSFVPSSNIIFLPAFIVLNIVSALAVGIWLSALTIRYRDFQHVVPFLVQFGLYATPVGYPASLVVERLPAWGNILFFMNPMAGVIEGYRWALFGGLPISPYSYLSFAMVALLFVSSLYYFRSVEDVMADIV